MLLFVIKDFDCDFWGGEDEMEQTFKKEFWDFP